MRGVLVAVAVATGACSGSSPVESPHAVGDDGSAPPDAGPAASPPDAGPAASPPRNDAGPVASAPPGNDAGPVALPPPYEPTGTLVVRRSGAGKITSDPANIDCGFYCFGRFSHFGPVTLIATPADGFRFSGWGGACSGAGACVLEMGATSAAVTARFEHTLPLPDGCAEVLPKTIPQAVTFDPGPGVELVRGTSDATGENFLFAVNPGAPGDPSRDYHFVRIRGAVATELAVRRFPYRNDATTYSVARSAESELVGFDVFRSSGEDLVFDVFAPDGTLLRTISTSRPFAEGETSQNAEYEMVPSGGVATVRYVWRGTSGYTLHYGLFDAQGRVVVPDAPLDMGGNALISWGLAASGNVLLVGTRTGAFRTGPIQGRWLDPHGAPLTAWFDAGDEYIRNFFLLRTPFGLALNASGYYSNAFRDARAGEFAAPGWLKDRGEQRMEMVRGGFVSYGVLEYGEVNPCGESAEVLTSTGVSCGCFALPDVFETGRVQSIGRDGSVFMSRALPDRSRFVFEVYPGLFR